jgi:hypothetical protein
MGVFLTVQLERYPPAQPGEASLSDGFHEDSHLALRYSACPHHASRHVYSDSHCYSYYHDRKDLLLVGKPLLAKCKTNEQVFKLPLHLPCRGNKPKFGLL